MPMEGDGSYPMPGGAGAGAGGGGFSGGPGGGGAGISTGHSHNILQGNVNLGVSSRGLASGAGQTSQSPPKPDPYPIGTYVLHGRHANWSIMTISNYRYNDKSHFEGLKVADHKGWVANPVKGETEAINRTDMITRVFKDVDEAKQVYLQLSKATTVIYNISRTAMLGSLAIWDEVSNDGENIDNIIDTLNKLDDKVRDHINHAGALLMMFSDNEITRGDKNA